MQRGRPSNKAPTTALENLLKDYGYNGSNLVEMGYFNTRSSVYGAAKRDVNDLKVKTLVSIGKAINLSPGVVLIKLLELQKKFPPKNSKKNKGTTTSK